MAEQHQFAQHCITERDAALAQLRKIAAQRDALADALAHMTNERDALAAKLSDTEAARNSLELDRARALDVQS